MSIGAYIRSLRVVAISGFVVGAAVGAFPWHQAWPNFSVLGAVRGAALGWVVGAAVAVPLAWAVARRGAGAGASPVTRPRRALRAGFTAAACAPALLWLTMATPGGVLRKAMASSRSPKDTRPNIILITIDALRTDHVGADGSKLGLTPNLDAFAREGTCYDSAYAESAWTLTSLGSLFTSLSPSQCVLDAKPALLARYPIRYVLRDDVPLLSEELSRAGYVTAAELTNHFLSPQRGWRRGFDHFRNESTDRDPYSDWTVAQHVTERAVEWLRLNRHEPFFLWVHYLDPHVPYGAPDTPADVRARYPQGWVADRRNWVQSFQFEKEPRRRLYMEFCREMYAGEVRYADRWVGELLKQINAAGLDERTLIAITADHGEELFDRADDPAVDHGQDMRESVVSVPLLVKWPQGVDADERITQTVPAARLHDTFLESAQVRRAGNPHQAGLPRHNGARGAEVFSEWTYYGAEQTALTTDEYKVIYHPGKTVTSGTFEVYDRRTDRREQHDLSNTPAAGELRARLKQLTRAALETRGAATAEHGPSRAPLSEKARRDLRSLGYTGE